MPFNHLIFGVFYDLSIYCRNILCKKNTHSLLNILWSWLETFKPLENKWYSQFKKIKLSLKRRNNYRSVIHIQFNYQIPQAFSPMTTIYKMLLLTIKKTNKLLILCFLLLLTVISFHKRSFIWVYCKFISNCFSNQLNNCISSYNPVFYFEFKNPFLIMFERF